MSKSHEMTKVRELLGPELTKILVQANHDIAQESVESELPGGILSPKQKADRLEKQAMEACEKQAADFLEGASLLMAALDLVSKQHPQMQFEKIAHEIAHLVKSAHEKSLEALSEANGSADLDFSFSDEAFEAIYTACSFLMDENRYSDAVKVLVLLCSIEPNRYHLWIGCAHAAYHNKQYDLALAAYYRAATLQPGNPWPLVWAAHACKAKGEQKAAFELLTQACEFATALAEDTLVEEIKGLLSDLSGKK